MTERPLFWTGNCAKARIIDQILSDPRRGFTVFDYGAGRGGDWPQILAGRPDLQLVCYEPGEQDSALMAKALKPHASAQVLTTREFEAASFKADFIVSFSVLEHVQDTAAYIAHGKRLLAADGVFHLNYDDGHFRTALDLDERRNWRQSLAVTLQNRMAWLWPRINRWDRYQARVFKNLIDPEIAAAGLAIRTERYENMMAMKDIWKTLPDDRRDAFTRFWIETEDRLNTSFRTEVSMRMGDTANLWRQFGSRTLALVHA
jgi:SAM-dependent methyltransferase